MAFDFSGLLPQFKALISSAQLKNRFTDIKTYLATTFNPAGITLPSADGTANQALVADGDTTTSWSNVIRSNVDLEHDAGAGVLYQALISDGDSTTSWQHMLRADGAVSLTTASLAAGDIIYYNGTSFVRLAKGSNGQAFIQGGSNAPTWQSLTTSTAPEVKTSSFSTAANGQFIVSTGVTTVTLHTPADVGEQFSVLPDIGTVNFETAGVLMAGAMQVNGATLDTAYLDQNVRYNFFSFDGTNWWVSGEVFDV